MTARVLYVRIRGGESSIGIGKDKDDAMRNANVFEESIAFCGVTDVVDALWILRKAGYYFVAPDEKAAH